MVHIQLVKAAVNGDENAFEKLIKSESDRLYRTAFLYVHNKEDALDVLQETVYKAFVSINQLKQPEFFSSWLTSILIRNAYTFLNKKKNIVLTGEAYLNSVTDADKQNIDQQVDLINAIRMLNLDYQSVIILFYYHDLPIRTIADILEKPEGTVKTYLRRAKAELKEILEGEKRNGKTVV